MYTCSCSCTRTCTLHLQALVGPGLDWGLWDGGGPLGRRCGPVKVGDHQVRSTHTQAKPGKRAWQTNSWELGRAGVPQSEREREYSVYCQATDDLPRSSPGCSLLTASFVCRVTAHVEMHTWRGVAKRAILAPGGVLFPGPKNDAAMA